MEKALRACDAESEAFLSREVRPYVEEFRLGASGSMGEAAGPGSLLNFTVKAGGNAFHGDVSFDYQNEGLVADNVPELEGEAERRYLAALARRKPAFKGQ